MGSYIGLMRVIIINEVLMSSCIKFFGVKCCFVWDNI